jgi:hypothetical protein
MPNYTKEPTKQKINTIKQKVSTLKPEIKGPSKQTADILGQESKNTIKNKIKGLLSDTHLGTVWKKLTTTSADKSTEVYSDLQKLKDLEKDFLNFSSKWLDHNSGKTSKLKAFLNKKIYKSTNLLEDNSKLLKMWSDEIKYDKTILASLKNPDTKNDLNLDKKLYTKLHNLSIKHTKDENSLLNKEKFYKHIPTDRLVNLFYSLYASYSIAQAMQVFNNFYNDFKTYMYPFIKALAEKNKSITESEKIKILITSDDNSIDIIKTLKSYLTSTEIRNISNLLQCAEKIDLLYFYSIYFYSFFANSKALNKTDIETVEKLLYIKDELDSLMPKTRSISKKLISDFTRLHRLNSVLYNELVFRAKINKLNNSNPFVLE